MLEFSMFLMFWLFLLVMMSLPVVVVTSCPNTCSCSQTSAVCSGSNIQSVVMALSPRIQSLEVSSAVQPKRLSADVLNSGSSLFQLKITGGNLQKISDHAFDNLESLVYLNLSKNSIFSIESHAFDGLVNLQELDLSGNRIVDIGESLSPLNKLHHLWLQNNKISSFSGRTFKNQGMLIKLNLQSNDLQTVQGYVFQSLTKLEELNLRQCKLTTFSGEILHLLPNLQMLDIGENVIRELPSISELNHVPHSLQTWLVDKNRITMLKNDQFAGLSLYQLNVSYNMISGLTDKVFSHFNVRVLDLSFNVISGIHNDVFRSVASQLEYLSLAGNPLHVINPKVFNNPYHPYRLVHLNLSRCSLGQIFSDQFDSLYGLRTLDISHNNLQHLPASVVSKFWKLQEISVVGNPWQCDCHIMPLRNWLADHVTSSQLCAMDYGPSRSRNCYLPKCYGPSRLTGVKISLLKDDQIRRCDEEYSDSGLGVGAIAGIVTGCLGFLAVLGVAILCYLRHTHRGCLLKKCKGESSRTSSHDDFQKECTPFQDFDRASLNESDKDYVVKKYFSSMRETLPSAVSRGSPTFTQRDGDDDDDEDNASNASAYTGVNSVFTFRVGYESTV